MKTVIFSDTHLGDQFDSAKMAICHKIITDADRVIIAGDFWDSDNLSFEQFLNSAWRPLLDELANKETIYLYGNHDSLKDNDQRISLFARLGADQYLLPWQDKTLLICHGHQLAPFWSRLTKKINQPSLFRRLVLLVESIGWRIWPRFYLLLSRGWANWLIRFQARKKLSSGQILVCGHTHLATFLPQKNYINLGCIKNGLAQYLVLDEDLAQIRLMDVNY